MPWALSDRDLEKISESVKQDILSEQIETYHRSQEAAQKILRTALAGIAIIVAFSGSEIFTLLLSLDLPSGDVSVAGGAFTINGALTQATVNTHFVGSLFLATSAGLALFAVTNTLHTLRIKSPRPLSPVNPSYRENLEPGGTPELNRWLIENDNLLKEISLKNERTYSGLLHALTFFVIGLMVLASSYLDFLPFMGFMNALVVILGPAYALYYLREVPGVIIRNAKSSGIIFGLKAGLDKYGDITDRKGPNPTYQVIYILFYGMYYKYSMVVVNYWLIYQLA